jgi:NitT/TauT family transport system substrate-binding protein
MGRQIWAALLVIGLSLASTLAQSAEPVRIVVSVPGPFNLSYLPIDLISRIGADKTEGVSLKLLHTGGGAVALNNLVTRNADFSVAGMPAAMSLRANGGDVVAITAVNDAPLFVLMVRAALKGEVKRIADLRGRIIGVNTSTKNSKTTSQQLLELLLKSDGVAIDAVRIVPAGQSWVEQASLLVTGTADAVMGDEPFASRLLAEDKVFFLANLADPAIQKKIPGANFLHAALETRGELIRNEPEKVEKMVRMLRATLQWMARQKPETIVGKLDIQDAVERDALLAALRKYRHAYSPDGRLSTSQLKETERFFRTTNESNAAAQALVIEHMVDSRWSGRTR